MKLYPLHMILLHLLEMVMLKLFAKENVGYWIYLVESVKDITIN